MIEKDGRTEKNCHIWNKTKTKNNHRDVKSDYVIFFVIVFLGFHF